MGRTLKCGWDEGGDMKVEIHYRWRVKSSAGKWFTTRHMATEESIRKQHPEAIHALSRSCWISQQNCSQPCPTLKGPICLY